MFPATLETDRLRLERLCHDRVDVEDYYDLWRTADPAVFEHLSATPFETRREAHDEIDAAEAAWDDGEAATYVVRPNAGEPDAGALAGRTSLDCDWTRRTGDLGIMLDRPFWGRGYSGERARALAALAFERLGLGVLTADHRAGNERSRRAVRKYVDRFGGQRDGVERLVGPDGDVETRHRYSVTRAEYRDATE